MYHVFIILLYFIEAVFTIPGKAYNSGRNFLRNLTVLSNFINY